MMKKRKLGNIFLKAFIVLLIMIACLMLGIAAAFYYSIFDSSKLAASVSVNDSSVKIKDGVLTRKINVLLLGVDDGDPENASSPKRSDTMMLVSIDPENKKVNIMSIPRDSRVVIPGQSGYDKITHAHAYGGPKLSVRTVEKLLGVPVNYYIAVDWQAFIKIVDILGGVNFNVEREMSYDDPYENLHIHLEKGYQHLDGQKAGQYVRFRSDELGDIGRVERQQKFMQALMNEMFKVGTIFKVPALVTTINKYVNTDMNVFTMIEVANTFKSMDSVSIVTETLPGNFADIGGVSYWQVDKEALKQVVDKMFK